MTFNLTLKERFKVKGQHISNRNPLSWHGQSKEEKIVPLHFLGNFEQAYEGQLYIIENSPLRFR